ncbi:Na+/H+ antiporter subunit G [Novosphingobium sp. 1949]|uniref:Na+/H+ antiporter subunit G n=1 Tax=Novosphingobium organovorum TaxID=2930092 RepID=A0ABT0BD18_9SPHN|nr:Na+/H+ antiporter subunit G [Novosphingobium organovorum]MCJ2182748.1 Na+/H+ antiporter subunit G [Novosphingobium organovorum]
MTPILSTALDALVAFLIVLGGLFALIGSWGLAKLPALMTRLHGPTKATTLGVGAILVASMVWFPLHGGSFSSHELLITLFLFLSAPISANMIAKAYIHRRFRRCSAPEDVESDLPAPPGRGTDWATFGQHADAPADPSVSQNLQGPRQDA